MILIIDGNNLAFSCNMITRLHTADGFPTQAIAGFFNSLHSYARNFTPEKIFVAWDGGKSKKRLELCPYYKANRDKEKTPAQAMAFEDFKLQTPLIKSALFFLGVYNCIGRGVEGDDLVAMLALSAEKLGQKAMIFSSDADFYQLVSPYVSVYSINARGKSQDDRLTTYENMVAKHGLRPEQWLDYKVLLGDSSDNIDGVPGVGEKTAQKLLDEFGTIENFLEDQKSESPTKVGKREKAIVDNPDVIRRNIQMMDLTAPTGDFSTVKILRQAPDHKSLRNFFKTYELKKFYLDFNSWISAFHSIKTLKENQ